MSQANKILSFIQANIQKHPADIVDITAKKFNVSRTTVHRHLSKLIKQDIVTKSGTTRDTKYFIADSLNREMKFTITDTLDEFHAYKHFAKSALVHLPDNIESICQYGFTEIFNNALEHSHATEIKASIERRSHNIVITIEDNGIGVFKSIQQYFHLPDIRESILQLSKGKMTTDPTNHTGEGLFFNSRAFDVFEIYANNLVYIRDNTENDWALSSLNTSKFGSKVVMTISVSSRTSLVNIWKSHQNADSLEFDRTEIIVELSRIGEEKLISRSQAKRILLGIETRFKRITLDFRGIKLIGQGFADEVFRVFQNAHPDITFTYINANDDIQFMIERSIVNL